MKTLRLVWFSGTGNTWLAAQTLAESLRAGGVEVTPSRMEVTERPLSLGKDDALGIAFPVACFTSYPIVWQFLEALPPGEGRKVVLIATMGGASGGMARPLGRVLRSKGYATLAAACFVMPSNYANRAMPRDANARKIERMRHDVAAFANTLLSGKARWPVGIPLWSEAMARMSRGRWPWRWFKSMFPLAVDPKRCTRCGLCAKLCPVAAIRMGDEGPEWTDACQSCQRCVGYCPVQAIHVPGKPAEPYASAPVDIFLS